MQWIDNSDHLPEQGRTVQVRRKGEPGYASNCVYSRTFKKFQSKIKHHDRVVITQWKCDQWRYQTSAEEPRRKKYNFALRLGGL